MSLKTNVSCRSQSRPATCSLSRTLYTATRASKSQSKNLERIAEDLLDLTKIERQDYSILFRLKMGLNQYGPAVSGIDPTSSESGSASADSKVVESGNCRPFVKLLSCLEIFQFLLNKLMERCCSLDWEFPVFVEHIL